MSNSAQIELLLARIGIALDSTTPQGPKPTEFELVDLIENRLPPPRLKEVASHIAHDPICHEAWHALQYDKRMLQTEGAGTGLSASTPAADNADGQPPRFDELPQFVQSLVPQFDTQSASAEAEADNVSTSFMQRLSQKASAALQHNKPLFSAAMAAGILGIFVLAPILKKQGPLPGELLDNQLSYYQSLGASIPATPWEPAVSKNGLHLAEPTEEQKNILELQHGIAQAIDRLELSSNPQWQKWRAALPAEVPACAAEGCSDRQEQIRGIGRWATLTALACETSKLSDNPGSDFWQQQVQSWNLLLDIGAYKNTLLDTSAATLDNPKKSNSLKEVCNLSVWILARGILPGIANSKN